MGYTVSSRLLALLFLALALPLGLLMVHLVPLGQVADEPAHVLRADSLLQGDWIGRRLIQSGPNGHPQPHEGVDSDRALLAVIVSLPHPLDTTPTRIDLQALARSASVPFGQIGFNEVGTIASYFPVFYLPAATALEMSRTFKLGARTGFLAARLVNLLCAVSLGAASLILARRGAGLLFIMLLLPPSNALMASVNQDGLLIACSALAAALATRIVEDVAPWRQPPYLGAAVLVGCICLAKPPYLPLTTLLLLPLGAKRPLRLRWLLARLAMLGLILLLVALWTWANLHYAAAPVIRTPEEAGPLWPGPRPAIFAGTDMAAQLHVLLIKPWRLIWLPVHSLLIHPEILRQMVDVLGWLNLMLPGWLVALWTATLALALIGAVATRVRSKMSAEATLQSTVLGGAILATIVLIYLSQYLSFTPVGWNWISGPQGRYLIPLLPMLTLAILPITREANPSRIFALVPATVAGLASLWALPTDVVNFYYIGAG